MRRMLTLVCLAGILVSALALSASASETNWQAFFKGGSGGTYTTPTGNAGTATAASSTISTVIDDELVKDPRDGGAPPNPTGTPIYAAWYRPTWTGGAVPFPLMRLNDYKGPLGVTNISVGNTVPNPSLIKTWSDLVVWAYAGYSAPTFNLWVGSGSSASNLVMPNSIGGQLVAYKLIMTHAPESYWNDPTSQKEWLLPTVPAAGGELLMITLPSAGAVTSNPFENGIQTTGYRFNFVTPEPGSLLALGAGLVGFAGLLRRRS